MTHIKRQSAPTNWPIERKGTKFIVTPLGSITEGVPVLILLRDILRITENRKEVIEIPKGWWLPEKSEYITQGRDEKERIL